MIFPINIIVNAETHLSKGKLYVIMCSIYASQRAEGGYDFGEGGDINIFIESIHRLSIMYVSQLNFLPRVTCIFSPGRLQASELPRAQKSLPRVPN